MLVAFSQSHMWYITSNTSNRCADVDHIANSMASIPYSFLQLSDQPTKHIPSIMATGPCLPVQLSKLLPGASSAFFQFSHLPGNYRAIYGPQEPYTSSSIPLSLP